LLVDADDVLEERRERQLDWPVGVETDAIHDGLVIGGVGDGQRDGGSGFGGGCHLVFLMMFG